MTVGSNKINYQGDIGTPTAHLETAKLLFNRVLSRSGAKFITLDLANFYLMTPMQNFEYMRIKLSNIPTKIIEEYKLHQFVHEGWIYIEIRRGAYRLPQAGTLAHQQLSKLLNQAGYYKAPTTPGL